MISKLRTKQIDFNFLMENIEGYTYHYNTTKWLKTKKRSLDEPGASGSTGPPPKAQQTDKKRSPNSHGKKRDDKRGEKIWNRDLSDKLKVPPEFKYGDIFRPEQRKGLTAENHDDGTIKCNN